MNYNILIYNPDYIEDYIELIPKFKELNNGNTTIKICENEMDLESYIREADILFVNQNFQTSLIHKAKKLKWIQLASAGVDSFMLNLENFSEKIVLTRVNTSFGEIMAEYALGYMLALNQKIPLIIENQKNKIWKKLKLSWLCNQTLGIAGVGKIGHTIAKKAKFLGMNVLGYGRTEKHLDELDNFYSINKLHEFLSLLDFLVITLPLTPQTKGLFGQNEFKAMPESSYIINIARGAIIKERELITALEKGYIKGAVLDVFEEEPLPKGNPLWDMDNVIVCPHHSGPSQPKEMIKYFIENLRRFERGETLEGVVNIQKGY